MSIATRTGDQGTTGLLHGQRVPKDHPQIEAVGAFDELNVEVGAARMLAPDPAARELLRGIQGSLVALMGEVACAQEDAAGHARSKFARLRDGDLRRLDESLAALERLEVACYVRGRYNGVALFWAAQTQASVTEI